MVIKLADYYKKCADCKKNYLPSMDSVEMQVTLMTAIQNHMYCTERCFENALSKINAVAGQFDRVKIVFKERVATKPDRWLVALEHDMPEIKILQ